MRGSLMRLLTKHQHIEMLTEHQQDIPAAVAYAERLGRPITPQNVRYWRKIFIENKGVMARADTELKEERKFIKPQPDDDYGTYVIPIPAVAHSILVIPDQHIPYHHRDMLPFLKAVSDAFNPDLVVNLGDELDHHALSFHDSDPNLDSAGSELEKAKPTLEALHDAFPNMLVCHSNHGSMHYRKAKAHGLPVQYIKKYRDVLFPEHGAPGWSWAEGWRIQTPMGVVMFKHQSAGILGDAAHNQCNLVVGHSHGYFSVEYAASSAHLYYGVFSGCLIDKDALAFAYGKHTRNKPIIGCTVILEGRPMLIPMVLDTDGRWIGHL